MRGITYRDVMGHIDLRTRSTTISLGYPGPGTNPIPERRGNAGGNCPSGHRCVAASRRRSHRRPGRVDQADPGAAVQHDVDDQRASWVTAKPISAQFNRCPRRSGRADRRYRGPCAPHCCTDGSSRPGRSAAGAGPATPINSRSVVKQSRAGRDAAVAATTAVGAPAGHASATRPVRRRDADRAVGIGGRRAAGADGGDAAGAVEPTPLLRVFPRVSAVPTWVTRLCVRRKALGRARERPARSRGPRRRSGRCIAGHLPRRTEMPRAWPTSPTSNEYAETSAMASRPAL